VAFETNCRKCSGSIRLAIKTSSEVCGSRRWEMKEQMDDAVEKSAMRKIYMRLLPFAILSYVLAYIDRITTFRRRCQRDYSRMRA
jgi:hypothetical protein